jgi:hypothetical protein
LTGIQHKRVFHPVYLVVFKLKKEHFSMSEGFIVFGAPEIQRPEIEEVVDSLESGWLGTGPKVARFEQDFATYR